MRGGVRSTETRPWRLGHALFLLALLLVAVCAAPTARAQAWVELGRHSETAAAVFSAVSLNAATSDTFTGLVFHKWPNSSIICIDINFSLDSSSREIFGLYRYRGSASVGGPVNVTSFSVTGGSASERLHIYLRSSYKRHTETILTVSLVARRPSFCPFGDETETIAWPVTVFSPPEWTKLDAHSDGATGEFSPVIIRESTSRTATGLAFHQSNSCKKVNVALAAGEPDSVELVRYAGASPATTTSLLSIHMEDGHAEDNHVKLMFKAGATLTAGSELTVTVNGTRHSSCTSAAPPTDPSIEWKLTVGTPAAWVDGAAHDTEADDLTVTELNAATADTWAGLAFHRTAAGCDGRKAELASESRAVFGLHRYDGSARETASPADEVAFTGAKHVRVYLRRSYQRHVEGVLQASLVVSGECSIAAKPAPQTLAWAVTVSDPDSWRTRGNDETAASGSFDRYALLDATAPTATGIQIHRSSNGCAATDVALAADTPSHLGLDVSGGAVELAARQAGVPMPGSGAGDRHVGLYFAAGAAAPAGELAVTATISASCAGSAAAPQELVYQLTVHTPAAHPWVALGQDRQTPVSSSYRWSDMVAGALATGIQLHRNSEDCRFTDVELLSGAEHLELVRYTAAGVADGAGSARQAAVRMEEGAAADRHVRLRFQAGALPPALVTATVRIAAAADCGSRRKPAPASFTYVLAVDADFDPAPELRVAPQTVSITRNAVATGVRAVAVDNDDADVAVEIDAAAARIFELRGAGGEYELRVRAAAELEVGVYTVTFTATDDAGGAAVTAQAAAVVRVRLGSAAATEDAAADAGGAVVRALGVSGIDAVLDRGPAADSGAGLALLEMLAAKEAELESGEIGLREFLEGQAVALPLSQTGAGGGYDVGIWLAGGRRDVGGVETDAAGAAVYVDGEASSTVFGVDARRGQVLAGLGYGLHSATADYGYEASRAADAPSGYELELRALQPYVAVDFGGARLALVAATGGGDLILRPEGEAPETLDVDYVGYALGLTQRLPLSDGGELRLRGSYAVGELDVAEPEDGVARSAALDSKGGVLRMGLGYGHSFAVGRDANVSPFLEAGYLFLDGDGSDAASGLLKSGVEFAGGPLAGGFSYQHAIGDDLTLAGYDFSIRFSRGLGGLGLGLEADPGYGLQGTEDLLADLGAGQAMALDADGYGLRGGAGLSYGLAIAGGLLTPYGRWSAGAGRELGLRLRAGARRSWALGYGAAADEFKIEYRLGD